MQAYTPSAASVATNGYYNMQPPEGFHYIVHNILISGAAVLEKYDSINAIAIVVDTATTAKPWMALQLHCSNTVYYRVKNASASANNIAADGVIPT